MYKLISIHAPAKGATRYVRPKLGHKRYFNPRSREGSDPEMLLRFLMQTNFNPRSREGSDFFRGIKQKGYVEFQSTLPRRERQMLNCLAI